MIRETGTVFLIFATLWAMAYAHPATESSLKEDTNISLEGQNSRVVLPLFVKTGCKILNKSGSKVAATCYPGELCRYTCNCNKVRKDRFSIICGLKPPLYLGVLNRAKFVAKMRGGSIHSDTTRLCSCK